MTQTPSVGRIVHYQSRGSADGHYRPEPRAAIITELHYSDSLQGRTWNGDIPDERPGTGQAAVYIDSVSLCVLNPTGMFFDEGVEYAETPTPGCWSWPPRV